MITYKEEINELYQLARLRLKDYAGLSREIRTMLNDGHRVTEQQLIEQRRSFCAYLAALGEFKKMTLFLRKARINYNKPVRSPRR